MKMSVAVMLAMFLVKSVHAQDFNRLAGLSVDINTPLMNNKFVEGTSAKGFKFSYRKVIKEKFMAGLDLGWRQYDTYQPPITIQKQHGAITTDYFNYVYSYVVSIAGEYFLPSKSEYFLPFVGLGLGASMNSFAQYYNVYSYRQDSWGFLVSPHAGLVVPLGHKIGAMASVHYDFSTTKSDYFKYKNFSNIGVQIGLVVTGY